MDIAARDDLSPTDLARVETSLYDNNRETTGHHDGRGLAFEALDSKAAQIGVIAGYSWARMAEIRQLWVEKPHRGQGDGRQLVEAFIAEAQARGCHLVWVTTYSFQAPGLYAKCGFEQVAELADWPPGHAQIILRRRLRSQRSNSGAEPPARHRHTAPASMPPLP